MYLGLNFEDYKNEIEYVFCNFVKPLVNFDEKKLSIKEASDQTSTEWNELFYLNNNFIVTLKDALPFNKSVVGEVVAQLSVVSRMILSKKEYKKIDKYKYRDALYRSAVLRGLMQWACAGKSNELVYNIVNSFSDWSIKTYERNRVKFGVIIQTDVKDTKKAVDFLRYIKKDISATISDGENTTYLLSDSGNILKVGDVQVLLQYFSKGNNGNVPNRCALAPLMYKNIAQSSFKSNLGITLSANGEICIFKEQQLILARLNGQWTIFDFKVFKKLMTSIKDIDENFIKNIYLSCLDVAFAGTGGCICVVQKGNETNIEEFLPNKNKYKKKVEIIKNYERNFNDMSRALRKELLAIDGACILYYDGKIRAFGAIVNNVQQQRTGGARAAAAATLSKCGIAIKISADGYMKIFYNGKNIM